jgi:hypothetical protein
MVYKEVSAMVAKNIIRILLTVAIVAVAFQTNASAETITFTGSFGPTASPFDMTYTFAGFDPTLGTLTEVILHADESLTTTGSITNLSDDTGSWHVLTGASVHVDFTNSLGASGVGTPPVVPTKSLTISTIDPNTAFLVNLSTADLNDFVANASSVPDIALFFVAPTITGNLHASADSSVSPPNSGDAFSSSLTSSVSGKFSVTYVYTPVPEPASGQMIGVGLVGLIAITFKARRKRSCA